MFDFSNVNSAKQVPQASNYFDPILGGAIIGGIGSIIGGAWGSHSAKHESERNRDFQERMSNTQWQRTVADMRAAGINPALAFSKGPNSSPSGSVSSNVGRDVVTPAISSALQIAQLKNDTDLKNAQQALLASQTANSAKDVEVKDADIALKLAALPKAEAYGNFFKTKAGKRVLEGQEHSKLNSLGTGYSALTTTGDLISPYISSSAKQFQNYLNTLYSWSKKQYSKYVK